MVGTLCSQSSFRTGPQASNARFVVPDPLFFLHSLTLSISRKLSLVHPLVYTRSSIIPLHILFEGPDQHALGYLSFVGDTILEARLCCSTVYNDKGRQLSGAPAGGSKSQVDDSLGASFITMDELPMERSDSGIIYKRQIYGEIHLPGSLRSTTVIPHIAVEVGIVPPMASSRFTCNR